MKPVETPALTAAPGGAYADGASQPVANYGLMADCNSAALVDRDGSIDWLCLPRYDSDAIFARILDPDGGHWSIRPAGSFSSERRYLPGTLVVETTGLDPNAPVVPSVPADPNVPADSTYPTPQ